MNDNLHRQIHTARWPIGAECSVDGSPTRVLVTAFLVRSTGHQYEVSWFEDGHARTAWIEDWRLQHYAPTTAAGFTA